MTNLEIEAFLAVVKTGSITRAADALFVTQPALSRRIKALETELGYPLIERRKGVRRIGLTEEGAAFQIVAEKWRMLWEETRGISELRKNAVLNVASVDSVSTYIMSGVYRAFLTNQAGTNLSIRTLHSGEAYGYVEGGLVDLAFVSDNVYSQEVEIAPAFQEPMRFLCGRNAGYPDVVHPSRLDPSKQIKVPWNPEYDAWNKYWFKEGIQPRVFLDKISLLEEFLFQEDNWAVVPASVADALCRKLEDVVVKAMQDGPGDRIIYYLLGKHRRAEAAKDFLACLRDCLAAHEAVRSLL